MVLVASGGRTVEAQIDAAPLPTMALARAEAFIRAAEEKLTYLPGEVVVKFRDGTSLAGQQRALDAIRSRPTASELQPIGEAFLLRDTPEWNADILSAQLTSQPEVEYAEPNYLYRLSRTPNDPGFVERQWHFSTIDLPTAWDINDGAPNVTVAVVDSGVTTVNQTFSAITWNGTGFETISLPFRISPDHGASRIVSPRDFISGDGTTVLDLVGHGTHVAGTVAQETNNGLGEAGIAYRARLMPVKVCVGFWEIQFSRSAAGQTGRPPLGVGGCDSAAIALGIRYAADNGAKVINVSLGGPVQSIVMRDAITYAVGRGAFVAIAVGNDFEEGNPVQYPAAYAATTDGAMSVGSVGRSMRRAYYSGTGSHLEIVAPGGDVRDAGANGRVWQVTMPRSDFGEEIVLVPRFDRYASVGLQGTSMASPHVAGVAALIISQGVTNPAAVEALIKRTARKLGTPDANRTGWNADFGFGLIQPRAALRGFGIAQ
jgi:serine protease